MSLAMFWGSVADVLAHGVAPHHLEFLHADHGLAFVPFMYLGAKHMVTGYDHLLFLIAVVFFLFRARDMLTHVSFFTIGHSMTFLFSTMAHVTVNAQLVDAIIGFSVLYKGVDNLGGIRRLLRYQPNTKAVVFIFSWFHGLGLATHLQVFSLPNEGLVGHLLSFNLGIEVGQCLALMVVLIAFSFWRQHQSYWQFSIATNTLLMSAGMVLMAFQLTGYFVS
jgi:hypothetical protein